MNKSYFYLFTLLILTTTSTVNSATFCATTSAELQQALSTAASNNQADIIKIRVGDYIVPSGGFKYQGADEDHGLEISGGWTLYFGNLCGLQFSYPLETILDGDASARVLLLYAGTTTGDFKVSNLTFFNGYADNPWAGGLRFLSLGNFSGNFLLERSAFFNNEANWASALLVEGGVSNSSKVTIRNNFFINNHVEGGVGNHHTVRIEQGDGRGIYFTNNTLILNTAVSGFGDLSISLSGSAKAFVANNIFWDNDNNDLEFITTANTTGVIYSYNNNIGTQYGAADHSANNISIPPLFEISKSIYIPIPAANSQMIDVGRHPPNILPFPVPFTQAWLLGETDFQGNPRVQGAKVDMGAYEAPPPADLIFANGFE